jgi:hypothetical protein
VFGSVLSPKDQWKCGACETKFKQVRFFFFSFSFNSADGPDLNRRRSSTLTRMARRIPNLPSSSSAVNALLSDSARETGKSSFASFHLPILIRLLGIHSKNCKRAVLSDAPFVKHDNNLWHSECFVCSYCVVRSSPSFRLSWLTAPSTEPTNSRHHRLRLPSLLRSLLR